MKSFRRSPWLISMLLMPILVSIPFAGSAQSAENDTARLARDLRPVLACLAGKYETFALTGTLTGKIAGRDHKIDLRFAQFSKDSFDLDLIHADYAVQIRRRADATAMALPIHRVVFVGEGETDAMDNITPAGITRRVFSPLSMVSLYAPLVQKGDPESVAQLVSGLLKMRYDEEKNRWNCADAVSLQFAEGGCSVDATYQDYRVQLHLCKNIETPAAVDDWLGLEVKPLERSELERQLCRGLRRTFEILAPSKLLRTPLHTAKKVEHGELRRVDGQRVVLLDGTPEQIGRAHGELVKYEALSCIDSVLYAFGTMQTIRTGRWFRQDLADAYAKLSPHIPERHKIETRAMAASLGMEPSLVESLNVFPELFHCSGFAVFGKATKNGKLYHGRVLDYMTAIGLQDAATTFVVSPEGKIPFVNVGYAGFTGSVTGMNARCISLGEMGGRGEAQWDGVPMATLMRRALEECSSLEEVKDLWKNSPRTCEYYYVFADGKTNQAVGVAATPKSVIFVQPGESHELLGKGIEDTVILSAGARLETLRQRVTEKYGQIDAEIGQWLMSRPVAMQSNLHNVLFIPQDGVLYIANADHKLPAADRPYTRLDLNELLESMPGSSAAATTARRRIEKKP